MQWIGISNSNECPFLTQSRQSHASPSAFSMKPPKQNPFLMFPPYLSCGLEASEVFHSRHAPQICRCYVQHRRSGACQDLDKKKVRRHSLRPQARLNRYRTYCCLSKDLRKHAACILIVKKERRLLPFQFLKRTPLTCLQFNTHLRDCASRPM